MMDKTAVERSIWINAPIHRVWQAITDPAEIIRWLVPQLPFAEMRRDEKGKITVHIGEMAMDFILLEAVDPPRQAIIHNLPDRSLVVTYLLNEQEGGTQVSVTVTGFERLPENAREDRLRLGDAGWEQALENLKAYINGRELPFPKAFVGPLFGYWREMEKLLGVERSIWINAPRERVWQALTDPVQIEAWFAPGTTFKMSGSSVGSRLYVENPEDGSEMYVQVLEVSDPPRELVLRSQPEPPETSFVTHYRLETENQGTRLTVMLTGYEALPGDTRQPMMEENGSGFGMMLGNIKAVIEGDALPQPGGF